MQGAGGGGVSEPQMPKCRKGRIPEESSIVHQWRVFLIHSLLSPAGVWVSVLNSG